MLFIQSNSLAFYLNEADRLRLLDALAQRHLTPLIRAARQRCFAMLLTGCAADAPVEAAKLEREYVRERNDAKENGGGHTPGELFCADDCMLFLTFGAQETGVSAGVIYNLETTEPLMKLDRFCRDVREALIRTGREAERAAAEQQYDLPCWKKRAAPLPQGLARFIAIQPMDFAVAAKCRVGARQLTRAAELMEHQAVRLFLQRVQEMRREGYTPRRMFAEADALMGSGAVEKMLDAGLLEREVRVTCRKSGHALFDLPSPDSLAAITISRAKCSQCAAPVADEVIEETINPTRLAVVLLEDGGWLNHRVYKIIRSLGVPDSEIATGPPSSHGESYLAADVCGNSFLFVTKDGDFTPAFCRRIVEIVAETEATHLCIVVTGAVEDEGRLRLYEFAWRRARGGRDLDTTLVEGINEMRTEIERIFERAVQRELSRHLFALDAALGFSASNFVLDWFKLLSASGAGSRAKSVVVPLFPDLDQRVAS